MLVVLVEFIAAYGQRDLLKARLQVQAADSLTHEPDCHIFDVSEDPGNPGTFLLYEVYTDAEAFEIHLKTAHFLSFADESEPMIAHKNVRRLERFEA